MANVPSSREGQRQRRLLELADPDGRMSFRTFMQFALYDREFGYYRSQRERVGTGPGTDFYTSVRMREVFAPLVASAAQNLLGDRDPAAFSFVEIGAEPGQALAADEAFAVFGGTQVVRAGDAWDLPPRAVVFANELLDAQPFHRVRFTEGKWRELGVQVGNERTEIVLPEDSEDGWRESLPGALPESAPEGYTLDLPLEAVALTRRLVASLEEGVVLLFDYGKDWADLIANHPAGTARAYYRHQQETDLLARPGEQDLTCHVVWDWLEAALREGGCRNVNVLRQEAFLLRHAQSALEALFAASDDRRYALQELLHPGNLGAKFQVLSGIR